jgi:chromosome segregation protein
VIGLAEKVVRCDDPQLAALPGRLLRRTVIVRELTAARQLATQLEGFRFITLQGELLDADGTLTVGTFHAEGGILSRKSELRELREKIKVVDARRVELERDLVVLRERLATLDSAVESQQVEIEILTEQAADLRSRLGQQKQRREGLHEEVEVSRAEIGNLEQDISRMQLSWQQARTQAVEADSLVAQLQARQQEADRELRQRNEQRHQEQELSTTAQVNLAQAEERLSSLRARQAQCQVDLQRHETDRQQQRQNQAQTMARQQENQATLLAISAVLAASYAAKEAAERKLADLTRSSEACRQERRQLLDQTQTVRSAWREQQEDVHARELQVAQLRHQAEALCARLQEDYLFDLADVYQRHLAAFPDAAAAEAAFASLLDGGEPVGDETNEVLAPADEIVELKRKLSRLGSVNLEAIDELKELEVRFATLQIQYDDLTAAQQALQEIISRINNDSRRLFTDTFATIRSNFQELFRKLFGGGMADIVLEDDVDILESGIEVIARPPGKELRSISLMSGGEKTMTAVALLLAIFRSRPSPFCILDEVDAALDEANVGRFTAVLRDYLDRSQFIIITHSKRTMQCADVLYGVTMQESGISRRMSIRFEDWKEDEPQPAA